MYLSPWKFFRNQILLNYSGRWRNQSCQIFFQSVHPGVSGKGSNFAIFSANRRWPLQLLYYRTTVMFILYSPNQMTSQLQLVGSQLLCHPSQNCLESLNQEMKPNGSLLRIYFQTHWFQSLRNTKVIQPHLVGFHQKVNRT